MKRRRAGTELSTSGKSAGFSSRAGERRQSDRESPSRKRWVRGLVPVYLVLITGIPLCAAATLLASATSSWRLAVACGAPVIYCGLYVLLAGCLSRFTLHALVSGRFPRDLGHEIYGPRRLYALCWTAIYYCAPIYHAVLAIPVLKRIVFRLFGYRGSLDFQTYPDTWIRDLPLLTIGKGAYLSNKATVSPNMCLKNGKIIVMPVSIGAGTMIGHLAMIAPGVEVGDDSEIGVGTAIGVNARIGSRTLVEHRVTVDHEVRIGDRCVIGTSSYIGRKAVIADGVRVPAGSVIPPRSVVTAESNLDRTPSLLTGSTR